MPLNPWIRDKRPSGGGPSIWSAGGGSSQGPSTGYDAARNTFDTAEGLGDAVGVETDRTPGLLTSVLKGLDTVMSTGVGITTGLLGADLTDAEGNVVDKAGSFDLGAAFRRAGDALGGEHIGWGETAALRMDEDDGKLERFAKGAGAFAGDVLSDPLTYVSFGTSVGRGAASRIAAGQAAMLVGDDALRAAGRVRLGKFAGKAADKDLLTAGKRAMVSELDNKTVMGTLATSNKWDLKGLASKGIDDPFTAPKGALADLLEVEELDRLISATGKQSTDDMLKQAGAGDVSKLPWGSTDKSLTGMGVETLVEGAYKLGGARRLRSELTRVFGEDTGLDLFKQFASDVRGGTRMRVPGLRTDPVLGGTKFAPFTQQPRAAIPLWKGQVGGGQIIDSPLGKSLGFDKAIDGMDSLRRWTASTGFAAKMANLGGEYGALSIKILGDISRESAEQADSPAVFSELVATRLKNEARERMRLYASSDYDALIRNIPEDVQGSEEAHTQILDLISGKKSEGASDTVRAVADEMRMFYDKYGDQLVALDLIAPKRRTNYVPHIVSDEYLDVVREYRATRSPGGSGVATTSGHSNVRPRGFDQYWSDPEAAEWLKGQGLDIFDLEDPDLLNRAVAEYTGDQVKNVFITDPFEILDEYHSRMLTFVAENHSKKLALGLGLGFADDAFDEIRTRVGAIPTAPPGAGQLGEGSPTSGAALDPYEPPLQGPGFNEVPVRPTSDRQTSGRPWQRVQPEARRDAAGAQFPFDGPRRSSGSLGERPVDDGSRVASSEILPRGQLVGPRTPLDQAGETVYAGSPIPGDMEPFVEMGQSSVELTAPEMVKRQMKRLAMLRRRNVSPEDFAVAEQRVGAMRSALEDLEREMGGIEDAWGTKAPTSMSAKDARKAIREVDELLDGMGVPDPEGADLDSIDEMLGDFTAETAVPTPPVAPAPARSLESFVEPELDAPLGEVDDLLDMTPPVVAGQMREPVRAVPPEPVLDQNARTLKKPLSRTKFFGTSAKQPTRLSPAGLERAVDDLGGAVIPSDIMQYVTDMYGVSIDGRWLNSARRELVDNGKILYQDRTYQMAKSSDGSTVITKADDYVPTNPGAGEGRRVYAITCGNKKGTGAAKAADQYQGSLFKQQLKWARAAAAADGGDVIVLSSKYGAILPDDIIEPYDLLPGSPGAVSPAQVQSQLDEMGLDGADFVGSLSSPYKKLMGSQQYTDAVDGLPLGKRKAKLKELTDAYLETETAAPAVADIGAVQDVEQVALPATSRFRELAEEMRTGRMSDRGIRINAGDLESKLDERVKGMQKDLRVNENHLRAYSLWDEWSAAQNRRSWQGDAASFAQPEGQLRAKIRGIESLGAIDELLDKIEALPVPVTEVQWADGVGIAHGTPLFRYSFMKKKDGAPSTMVGWKLPEGQGPLVIGRDASVVASKYRTSRLAPKKLLDNNAARPVLGITIPVSGADNVPDGNYFTNSFFLSRIPDVDEGGSKAMTTRLGKIHDEIAGRRAKFRDPDNLGDMRPDMPPQPRIAQLIPNVEDWGSEATSIGMYAADSARHPFMVFRVTDDVVNVVSADQMRHVEELAETIVGSVNELEGRLRYFVRDGLKPVVVTLDDDFFALVMPMRVEDLREMNTVVDGANGMYDNVASVPAVPVSTATVPVSPPRKPRGALGKAIEAEVQSAKDSANIKTGEGFLEPSYEGAGFTTPRVPKTGNLKDDLKAERAAFGEMGGSDANARTMMDLHGAQLAQLLPSDMDAEIGAHPWVTFHLSGDTTATVTPRLPNSFEVSRKLPNLDDEGRPIFIKEFIFIDEVIDALAEGRSWEFLASSSKPITVKPRAAGGSGPGTDPLALGKIKAEAQLSLMDQNADKMRSAVDNAVEVLERMQAKYAKVDVTSAGRSAIPGKRPRPEHPLMAEFAARRGEDAAGRQMIPFAAPESAMVPSVKDEAWGTVPWDPEITDVQAEMSLVLRQVPDEAWEDPEWAEVISTTAEAMSGNGGGGFSSPPRPAPDAPVPDEMRQLGTHRPPRAPDPTVQQIVKDAIDNLRLTMREPHIRVETDGTGQWYVKHEWVSDDSLPYNQQGVAKSRRPKPVGLKASGGLTGHKSDWERLAAKQGFNAQNAPIGKGRAAKSPEVLRDSKVWDGVLMDDYLRESLKRFGSDGAWEKFSATTLEPYMRWFRTQATVGRGPGFVVRNLIGGLSNARLVGATSRDMIDGMRIAQMWRKADKLAIEAGDIGSKLVKKKTALFEGMVETYYGPQVAADMIEQHRIFHAHGLADITVMSLSENATRGGKSRLFDQKTVDELGPISRFMEKTSEGIPQITRPTSAATKDVEHAMRFGSFLAGARRYGWEDGGYAASMLTKASQFDYGDLSHFERNVMRQIIPFYTFTRKNLPLQMRGLVNDPAKFSHLQALMTNAEAAFGATEDEEAMKFGDVLPGWFDEQMGFITDQKVGSGFLGIRAESPKMALEQFIPGNLEAATGRKQLESVAGATNPVLKTAVAAMTGRDPYTNVEVSDSARNIGDYFARQLSPIYANAMRVTPLGSERDRDKATTSTLSSILGAPVTTVDEKTARSALRVRSAAIFTRAAGPLAKLEKELGVPEADLRKLIKNWGPERTEALLGVPSGTLKAHELED
jgi:hypothetical protein